MGQPRNARTTSRGRTYTWDGDKFDSVTTIIGGGMPKPALVNWAPKMVAEFVADNLDTVADLLASDRDAAIDLMKRSPWRDRDLAANRGSEVHDYAEARVIGKPMPDPPAEIAPYVDNFARFLEDFRPAYEAAEATVYSRRWGYAGTFDALFRLDGHGLVLVDYKTNRSGLFGEVALQLAAYRHAEFIGGPDGSEIPMPQVDECMALHISADGYSLVPVRAGDAEFKQFLRCRAIRRFVETESREVLSDPLSPASREEVNA